jgi:coenzyme F420-reducing hydrogenase beta subunit
MTQIIVIAIAILAMVLYPDAQKKAQEEIDKVIGIHCLPTFEYHDCRGILLRNTKMASISTTWYVISQSFHPL